MRLLDIFKTTNQFTENQEIETTKEIVNNKDTYTEKNADIVTINYGTGYPIDAIYAFIRVNNEDKGFNDALCAQDISYLTTGKELIKNELKNLFTQIKLRYKNEIQKLETDINLLEALCMQNTANNLIAQKEIYQAHIAEIEIMDTKVDANSPDVLLMVSSYERGFQKGLVARTATLTSNLTSKTKDNE